jgi:hypothetical protein
MALICGHLTQQRVRGLGGEIAMTPYRSCVPPSTIWSSGDSCWGGAIMRPLFWWRRCWTAGADGDVTEVEAAIERVAAVSADEGLVMRDIWLLRLRALLARAHADAVAYASLRDRYRAMAKSLGFEGHMECAEAMP